MTNKIHDAGFNHPCKDTCSGWKQGYDRGVSDSSKEIERLNKVITRELSENDEIGCEYTYVRALKEEVTRLREALSQIRQKVINNPKYSSQVALGIFDEIIRKALEGK